MTTEQLDVWLDHNKNIEWTYDEGKDEFAFRDIDCPYYVNHPEVATVVSGEALRRIDGMELYKEINRGLRVEGITRVTGYFSKVSQFNKGKKGELVDRHRSGHLNP